jgi:signal transduction histidine kinase
VQALRPQALEETDLCEALDTLFTKMTAGTKLRAEFVQQGNARPLPSDWEDNILQIGREALTNVLRHARASHFRAQIAFARDAVHLDFRDDGAGFDPARQNGGFGVRGMRERVERMGGRFSVRSRPGDGAAISITLPQPQAS